MTDIFTQEDEAVSKRVVIFIIGTMRSGTSALTRVLSLCGCDLPKLVLGPRSSNPTGNWDPVESIRINTEFLFSYQTMHGDPTMCFHETSTEDEAGNSLIEKIEHFLKSCPGTAPLVIKEHTITELVPYWTTATYNLGYTPTFIIPVRRVAECVLSTRLINPSQPDELTQHIWLRSNLLAERNSRQTRRVFVEYSELMNDWALQMSRVSSILNVSLRIEGNTLVQDFLDPRLQHHRKSSDDSNNDGLVLNWCEAVYREFSAAASGKPLEQKRIDNIYNEFLSAERSFRIARDFFRNQYDPAGVRRWLENEHTWNAGTDF